MHLRITEQLFTSLQAVLHWFIQRKFSLPPSSKGFGKVLFVRTRILINIGNIKFLCDKSKL